MDQPTVLSFGELLRHYRRTAGLTQEVLAERAGVSVRAMSDLERGVKTRPLCETVALLARLSWPKSSSPVAIARRAIDAGE